MGLIPITELSVAEAYAMLVDRLGAPDLPPLEAIEGEDWARDFLLGRLAIIPPAELVRVGLCRDAGWDRGG